MPRRWLRVRSFLVVAILCGVFGAVGAVQGADLLIKSDDSWRFFRGRTAPSDPATAWRDKDFVDTAWEQGATGIGYGDNDDATVLNDMQNVYWSLFARKSFTVANPATIANLTLLIDYDDGFVAYLNGQEVARENLGNPNEDVAFDAPAVSHEVGTVSRIDLTAELGRLTAGTNVLAVEVHNTTLGSSDLSFIPTLIGNDDSAECPSGFTCAAQAGQVQLRWTLTVPPYDKIEVLRNGTPLTGSPFAGDAVQATDTAPGPLDARYELIGTKDGAACLPLNCTSTTQAHGASTLVCALEFLDGATQAQLTWQNIPNTQRAEIRREGALVATLTGGETGYRDLNVESDMPEDDTEYEVRLFDASGGVATMNCGGAISLCPTLVCGSVNVGGVVHARVTIGNLVKEWTLFALDRTVAGTTVILADTLPPTTTEYVDESIALEPGVSYTYTLRPTAPAGEQVGCDRACAFTPPIPEAAAYKAPAGGWDYSIDFEAHPGTPLLQYNPLPNEGGNLDGQWVRSIDRDFWDGSAPEDTGQPGDGKAPGGLEIVTRAGQGPCGTNIKALRILDPGDPSLAGGALAGLFPVPFAEPSNKAFFLGFDTGIFDRNLLRTGVTFSMRWRIDPLSPAYMGARAPTGDGEPLVGGGLGQIGFYFRNLNSTLATEGANVCASFALNTGDTLQFSGAPNVPGVSTLAGIGTNLYRALWVTIEDPEADGTYKVSIYLNGQLVAFPFGTGDAIALDDEDFDFGGSVGNYLAIGLPDVGNDAIIEIDSIAYKLGVHTPDADACVPGANNPPTAVITTTPASREVTLAAGAAQVTLDAVASNDGDGGAQGLTYVWSKVSGPGGSTITQPSQRSTTVQFTAPGSYIYRLTVSDGQPTNATATADVTITVRPEQGGSPKFFRGDTDGNRLIELTDAVGLLNSLFLGAGDPACADAADFDDNGVTEITDAIASLTYQFLGGPGPAPPGADICASDPNEESPDLGCTVSCG